ncbi:T9SS type A sorting domain-containing protein [Ascidiimonas sp. W6]|uniref:T9SS type A sorting domain-containing protein n=1 Tax=Ascidiimonas meishanensis TaxID=3128903 RepID=UPI0030EDB482
MKPIFLTLTGAFLCISVQAQTKLIITYDASGNQLERSYCNGCNNRSVAPAQNKEKQLPEASKEATPTDQTDAILILPNPTEGEVVLSWEANFGTQIAQIKIVGYHTPYEKTVPYQKGIQAVAIDLSKEPSSIYIVQFFMNDGTLITKKIIKQ